MDNSNLRTTSDMSKGFCIPWNAKEDGNTFIIEKLYHRVSTEPSDIHEHVKTLNQLARNCNHITELGVRFGVSSVAFMNSDAVLRSYDILIQPEAEKLFDAAITAGKNVMLIKANSLDASNIDITDLLFIDTIHAYPQLKAELNFWENKVRKFIVLHDTITFADNDEVMSTEELLKFPPTDQKGLLPAINEFIAEYPWEITDKYENNNGLTVLRRIE